MVHGFGVHTIPSMHDPNLGSGNDDPSPLSGEVSTPETEPPTQGLAQSPDVIYNKLSGDLHREDDLGVNLVLDLDPGSSSTTGY